jgi:hypothetical protein
VGDNVSMTAQPCLHRRHRFPGELVSHAVWLYHLFSLSLRDVELILAEGGVLVTRERSAIGAAISGMNLPSECSLIRFPPRWVECQLVRRMLRRECSFRTSR